MTPTNRGGQPSRVILDPVTLESVELLVEIKTTCAQCGNARVLEVYNELEQLVRREAHGQLCWHYRANQSNRQTLIREGVDKTSQGSILERERR